MFLPERPSQRSLRRIASYRALQAQMRDKRAHRLQEQPPKTMSQHRILIIPPRRVIAPAPAAVTSVDVADASIAESNILTSGQVAYPLGRMITTTYHNLVSYAVIELDRDRPSHIDKSLGLAAHDVRVPAKQRDG